MDLLHDHGLKQMVMEPAQLGNILDLSRTNCPHLMPRNEVIPGLSDHDIVYGEFNIYPNRVKQLPGKIPLYSHADWDGMRSAMDDVKETMGREKESLTTEELWAYFKDSLLAAPEHIPHNQACLKSSKPQATAEIWKLIKRRDRVYKQMKKLGSEEKIAKS